MALLGLDPDRVDTPEPCDFLAAPKMRSRFSGRHKASSTVNRLGIVAPLEGIAAGLAERRGPTSWIVNGHPNSAIDQLLPWAYRTQALKASARERHLRCDKRKISTSIFRFQLATHSEIQGPVSFSKYLSNRRIKSAAAAQMIKKVTSQTTSTSCALQRNKAARRNMIAWQLCVG